MAGRTLEQQVAALRTLDIQSAGAVEEVRKALRSKRGFVIAAAAKLVVDQRVDALVDELAAAFETLLGEEAVKRDPGCRGKIAIATGLIDLDEWNDRVFVAGLGVVQHEGMIGQDGTRDDTAATVRGLSGIAHARFARPDALDVLAALLADDERNTRIAAAQGLGDAGRADATALLRYKLLCGDEEEPAVIAQCFDSLFSLAREASSAFAIEMLAQPDLAEAAAIALGGQRVADALGALVTWCERCKPEPRRRVGYVAVALLRSGDGNAWLVEQIRTRPHDDAVAAARALATFKDDAAIADSLRGAARETGAKTRQEIEALLDR